MEKNFEFVYRSELQVYGEILSTFAGGMIGMLPLLAGAGVFSPYIDTSKLPDGLQPAAFIASIVLMFIGLFAGAEIGGRFKNIGTLQIYSNYSMLHYGKKTLLLKKNEFSIKKVGKLFFLHVKLPFLLGAGINSGLYISMDMLSTSMRLTKEEHRVAECMILLLVRQ